MYAPYRLTRLITAGLAACAVTWALVASAVASPATDPPTSTGDRPAYKVVPGDVKEPQSAARPAFKVVPGDVKTPESSSRPAFKPVSGDTKSDADRARAVAPVVAPAPARDAAPADNGTSTVALIVSIAAILTALGAITLTVARPPRGALRA
jgi:hypothetical protein